MMDGMAVADRNRAIALADLVRSAEQWAVAGISRGKLRLLLASGDLVKVRHGCYADAGILAEARSDPCLAHAVKVAALMAASRHAGSVASHYSAARMHGLDLLHPPGGEVITTTGPSARKSGGTRETDVVRHAAALPAGHVTRFRGVPVTTVARTVADIARVSTFAQGVVVADSALRRDPTSRPAMRSVLADCRGWPGVDLARKVIEFADKAPETPLESAARAMFHECGLPPPLLQAPILGTNRAVIARVDFCWPEYGATAESDGLEKYRERGGLKRDHQRDSRIREVGWEVTHFLWDELFADPDRVVARIRFAFERGRDPAAVRRRAQFFQAVTGTGPGRAPRVPQPRPQAGQPQPQSRAGQRAE